MKKLYIFDLDGTLAPSKSPLESETLNLLLNLLALAKVAIITGGSYRQLHTQFVDTLASEGHVFYNLYLLPTNGAALYTFQGGAFASVYNESLTSEEKERIIQALKTAMEETHFVHPEELYGNQIEDREAQITFSALGQDAPLAKKEVWDPDQAKRRILQTALIPLLPEFEVRIGGTTTIDITKRGITKAYGIRKLMEYLQIPIGEAIFVGDSLFEGGNDATAKETGIATFAVGSPSETRAFIERELTNN